MKKLITASICFAGALTYCLRRLSEPATVSEAGAPASRPALITRAAHPRCRLRPRGGRRREHVRDRSFRGGAPSAVVCPAPRSASAARRRLLHAEDRRADGACTSLSECRALALQCDGPEDCDGGCAARGPHRRRLVVQDRGELRRGQWLCRTDSDCINARPARVARRSISAAGDRHVGLDGIVGVCGK